MTMFNSLAYATKLVNTGLPRAQAEVHAQELQEVLERECGQYATKADLKQLQEVLERECGQYATKADLIALGSEVKAEIKQLEEKTDRLEAKTGRLEAKIDGCIAEFAGLRADVTVLTSSHKFVLWIGGGVATMCLSVFGLMVTTLWPSLK
jgi:chromosome segregation ATPase